MELWTLDERRGELIAETGIKFRSRERDKDQIPGLLRFGDETRENGMEWIANEK